MHWSEGGGGGRRQADCRHAGLGSRWAAGLAGLQQVRVHCVRLAREVLHDLLGDTPCGVDLSVWNLHSVLQYKVTFTSRCGDSAARAADNWSCCQACVEIEGEAAQSGGYLIMLWFEGGGGGRRQADCRHAGLGSRWAAGLAGLQQGRVHCVRLALEALHDLIVVSPCGVELGRIHRLLQCDVTFTLCCPNSSTTAMDDMSSCQAYACVEIKGEAA